MTRNAFVTIDGTKRTFKVRPQEMILDAAARQGVALAHSCRRGTCRTCMVRVIAGTVEQQDSGRRNISVAELQLGYRLICCSTAEGDVILTPSRARSSLLLTESTSSEP